MSLESSKISNINICLHQAYRTVEKDVLYDSFCTLETYIQNSGSILTLVMIKKTLKTGP